MTQTAELVKGSGYPEAGWGHAGLSAAQLAVATSAEVSTQLGADASVAAAIAQELGAVFLDGAMVGSLRVQRCKPIMEGSERRHIYTDE